MTMERADSLILLAEDDMDDRLIFQEAFRELDDATLSLRTVEDGLEVVNVLKDIREDEPLPNLFVLDQNMPKMTGKATLTFLKSSDRFRNIPVVVYSTYPDQKLIEEFKSLGADYVTSKPDTYEGFKTMVRELIQMFVNQRKATR